MAAVGVWFGSLRAATAFPADRQAAEIFYVRSLPGYVKQQLREVQRKDGCVLVLFPGIWDAATIISRNAPHVFAVSSIQYGVT